MSTNNTYLAGIPRRQKQPAHGGLECASRSRAARKGTSRHGRLESVGRKTSCRDCRNGRPLGKTKKASQNGIEDISNEMGAFTIVRAASHEAAAKLFENHPHFTIFPWRTRGDHAGSAHTRCVTRGEDERARPDHTGTAPATVGRCQAPGAAQWRGVDPDSALAASGASLGRRFFSYTRWSSASDPLRSRHPRFTTSPRPSGTHRRAHR